MSPRSAATDVAKQFTFVDRPKLYPKVVTLLIWGVAAYLAYKGLDEPLLSWPRILTGTFFLLCCVLLIREFLFRPTRTTTLNAAKRELVIEETSLCRHRQMVATLSVADRFEIHQIDSDNTASFEVRLKSIEHGWLVIAEYLPRMAAERLADEVNCAIRGATPD